MRLWWGKSPWKGSKKKANQETLIDASHKKFKTPEIKSSSRSRGARRRSSDTVSERRPQSQNQTRSPSPSKYVVRCLSFAERPQAQPLPLPRESPLKASCTDSRINESPKSKLEKVSKSSLFRPLPRPACIRPKLEHADLDCDLAVASVRSECSMESDDLTCSHQCSPLANDYDNVCKTATGSPSSISVVDQPPVAPAIAREPPISVNLSSNKLISSPPRRRPLNDNVQNLLVPHHGAFFSAPDSSMPSPSRSPMRTSGYDQVTSTGFTAGKLCPDFLILGSGQCSSPGSGQTSGHNSMVGDISGQLFCQPSRGSPEYSPNPSPRITSPGPSSRIHSGAVTPLHARAGGAHSVSQSNWLDDAKQQSHRLPLPPIATSISTCFSHQNSTLTSPSVPLSPGRAENHVSPGSRWKKGRLLGRGTFGHVYVGFNSETGEMCAMKEVTLFADDAKSKESAKQLGQEIALLSRLRHPNIVQYYGSEMMDDKLYIYLEYVSGGSIYKILQEYGKLGESAIRLYTQQILSGLAYLHAKNNVHRDIKGANILVDPNGRVKLADFGMAKHITGQTCPLSLKGSPYWMAPEVIRNSNGCSLAVDIWSLGCTVLEMATSRPPWSQYEGVAAMFKIGNSKELPVIPDHLSDEGKEFVRLCLQRNPAHRPTAAQLLKHAFVKTAVPLEKHILRPTSSDHSSTINTVNSRGIRNVRTFLQPDVKRLATHSSRTSQSNYHSSDIYILRNISCPVSPVGSPLLHPRLPQHLSGRMSPSPISSPRTTSGSSTPLSGSIGAVPFNSPAPMSLHEGFGSVKTRETAIPTRPPYWDPDLLRGVQSGSYAFRELKSYDTDGLGKQFVRADNTNGEVYDGNLVSADRVSQQLLRDPVKLNLAPSYPSSYNRV